MLARSIYGREGGEEVEESLNESQIETLTWEGFGQDRYRPKHGSGSTGSGTN